MGRYNLKSCLCLISTFVLKWIEEFLKPFVDTSTFLRYLKMTESSKKKRKNPRSENNLTNIKRTVIDANWQLLLASNLLTEKKAENNTETAQKHYTGPFRRARKKNNLNSATPSKESLAMKKKQETPLTETKDNSNNQTASTIHRNKNKCGNTNKITKFIALDCEMVGVGYDGKDNMLARVSIVNKFGDCIYDKFVKPREEVVDYRTEVSGVRREDLLNGEEFATVQKEVAELLRGRILVGHSLKNDFEVLFLSHPKRNIRDTSKYKPFKQITRGNTPSLKRLTKEILGVEIQKGEHNSVEDARAVMKLYSSVAKKWEMSVAQKRGQSRPMEE